MNWAERHIKALSNKETVTFRPRGHSMSGIVNDGDRCTVEPVEDKDLNLNDVVLCTVNGRDYLHLIKGIGKRGYLIGNNRGGINGWTKKIHGIVTDIVK